MADQKVTDLTELAATPDGADLVYIVDDPGGTPVSKKITVSNLLSGVAVSGVAEVVGSSSPSSVSEVDFALPSGYGAFELRGWFLPATDGVQLWLRCDDGGGFDSSNEYMNVYELRDHTNGFGSGGGNSDAQIFVHRPNNLVGNVVGEGIGFTIGINGALSSAHTYFDLASQFHDQGSNRFNFASGGGRHAVASPLTALRLMFSSGDIAVGEVRLIGYP